MRLFRKSEKRQMPASRQATIDAVTMAPNGAVSLILGCRSSMPIDALQERVQHYVSFALDGQMVKLYPETSGQDVRIVLAPDDAPTVDLLRYVDQVRPVLVGYGIAIDIDWHGA